MNAPAASGPIETSPRAGGRSFRLLLGSAVAVFLVLLATSWFASFRDLRRANAREALLQERIETAETRNQELRQRIERLRDDPILIESLAREQLGLVREGEVVVVFPEETP